MGELRRHARNEDDVARALTIAADAIEGDEPARALPYLEWSKSDAPRAPSIREMLGITYYLVEDWGRALSELQTYRRLTGRDDQNHLIADCMRAQGRDVADVGQVASEIDIDEDGADRFAEAMIVWSSALADTGEVDAARAVLRRALDALGDVAREEESPPEFLLRLWYVAGDLAQQAGEEDEARRWFARVVAVDGSLYDVEERLAALA